MTTQTEPPLPAASEHGDIIEQPSQEKAVKTKPAEYNQDTPGWPWDL